MQPPDSVRKGWTSASNAAADNLCAGRHLAQAGLPDVKSADATAGTAIHEALKTGDPSKLTLDQRETFDSCQAIEAKLVAAVFGETVKPAVFREQRYWCKIAVAPGSVGAGVTLEHSGQADVVYRAGTRALVLDYKTLQGDVADSPQNLQLRDLACLVAGNLRPIDSVATAIIQPLVTHSPEVCLYDAPDLVRAEAEMFARVAASNQPGATRTAGEVQCKYCLAKTKCPAYTAWVGALIPGAGVEPVVKELLFQMAMDSWTPPQRAMAASLLSPAGKALEDIKDFLKAGIESDPAFVPGWELKLGSKIETITDPQACFDRFAAIGGKLEAFMGAVTVGKTKLKEALNGVTGSIGKKLDQELAKLTEGIVESKQNAPSLVKSKEPSK